MNAIKIINKESPVYLQELIREKIEDVKPQSRYPDTIYSVNSLELKSFGKPSSHNLSIFGTP